VLGLAAFFASGAAAATLALNSASLSAGSASVASCGVSALAATRNVDNAGNVTRVNVTSIPASCAGETLSLTLVGAGGANLGGGTADVGNCTSTCSATLTSLGGAVSAANVLAYSFAVTGQ
jgi:hypothetical protein